LAQKVETLAANGGSSSSRKSSSTSTKSTYETAEANFQKKAWKDAIVEYQKYRDRNPKGRHYSESTYKIGVCFQELGMRDEAKSFYSEVIAKFPKTKSADKAKIRLKQIK
jgi:TolA-binding protein